jgi:hypothetical protein
MPPVALIHNDRRVDETPDAGRDRMFENTAPPPHLIDRDER